MLESKCYRYIVRYPLIKIFVTLLLVLVLSGALSVVYLNRQILRSDSPEFLQLVVRLFLLPNDYYDSLVEKELVITEGEAKEEHFEFANYYYGMYSLRAVFDNFEKNLYSTNNKINLEAFLECKTNSEIVFKNRVSQGSAFLGKTESGYIVGYYSVPNDLPLDTKVSCRFRMQLDEQFVRKYGPIKIKFQKLSDL